MALHSPLRALCDDYARGMLERGDYRRKRAELLAQLTAPPAEDEPHPPTPAVARPKPGYWLLALVTLVVVAGAMAIGWYLGVL